MNTIALLGALAVLAAAPAGLAQEAPAQAPPAAQGLGPAASPELMQARKAMRQACAADTARLCGEAPATATPGASTADAAPPAQGGVGGGRGRGRMQCLRTHAADLSDGCRQAMIAMRAARGA